jgi:radical SAM protein with 4Fe4S-binding SPASM domain
MTTERLLGLVGELVDLGNTHLFIEGGEPLLRPDLFEVLSATCPFMMTWLRTNATLIDRHTARAIRDIGVGTVCVDVLGARPESHDLLTGCPGSFERSLEGIANLKSLDVPIIMLLILNRHNHLELQAYLDLAAKLGVNDVGILRLYPLGRAKRRWSELALSHKEMYAAIERLDEPKGMRVMRSWHPRDGNCCWQNAAVGARGDSIGCPYLREYVNYGNIHHMSFRATWDHPLYQRLRSDDVERACPDCAASQHSRGGCRATAYAFRGRWTAPDPFCPQMGEGVNLRELPERLLPTN